ncbi:MAG TPA: DUF2784 domain-containing protein [Mycobacterium sp.]|nr:DUF2784 domain-containing protein [Mycobacterium sp.]HQC77846.1 DUF2784 domain-containing protein [Mycobacterium sp.]
MRPLCGSLVWVALVWLAAAAHLAFLLYVPAGGFLALRWRRSIRVHIAAVLWGIGVSVLGFWCPLTALERWARPRAGMAPLNPGGFIEHYLTGHLWPSGGTGYVQTAAFIAVLASWIAYALTARDSKRVSEGGLEPPRPLIGH